MDTLLVPLDGSPLAEQALPYARLLAPLLQARITLFRVIPDNEVNYTRALGKQMSHEYGGVATAEPERDSRVYAMLEENARAYLNLQAQQLRGYGLDVEIDVDAGAPASLIIDYCQRRQGTLIVMATHGYSGVRRWALGSVADKIVRTCDTPVLLVHGATTPSAELPALRRIFTPIDGSDFSRQALPLSLELAKRANAELILLQAVEPMMHVYMDGYMLPEEVAVSRRKQALADLTDIVAGYANSNVRITPTAAIGYPAEEIINRAEQAEADLIVMATHGYSGVRRWMLGSVADKVLHATNKPLLLVRPKE